MWMGARQVPFRSPLHCEVQVLRNHCCLQADIKKTLKMSAS